MATKKNPTAPPRKATMKSCAPEYLRYSEIYNVAGTITVKKTYVRRLVAFFRSTPLANIKRADVDRYVAARKPYASDITINREVRTLRHLFNYAIDRELVKNNPARRFRFFREKRQPLHIPAPSQVVIFLRWCTDLNPETGQPNDLLMHDLVTLAFNTGLRRGDVLKIRGEDIDLENRQLRTAISKTGDVRDMPLNDAAFEVLSRRKTPGFLFCRNNLDRDRAPTPRNARGQILPGHSPFPNGNGDGTAPLKHFNKRFKSACKAAGVHFRFKELRHAFACGILEAGGNIKTLQDLLVHTSITTTQLYLFATPAQKREAVNALPWANAVAPAAAKPNANPAPPATPIKIIDRKVRLSL